MPKIRTAIVAALALCTTAATAVTGQETVRLTIADGPRLDGHGYTLTLSQDVALQTGADTHIIRDAGLRFHFRDGERVDDASSRTVVMIDSARASVSSPHGREVIDARRSVGRTVTGAYRHGGGQPEWTGPALAIELGSFGGPLPVTSLVEHLFVALAGSDSRTGAHWDATWRRRQIDGNEWAERSVSLQYTLDRIETRTGAALAHISFESSSSTADEPTVSGSMILGVDDGVVRELSLEDVVSGTWMNGEESLPFEQTTTLHISLVASPAAH